jgi:site-specific recombinase XerD
MIAAVKYGKSVGSWRITKMKGTETGLDQAVSDFLAHVKAQGGSARTDDFYVNALRKRFLPWCRAEGITAPGQLDQATLNRFNVYLLRPDSGRGGQPLAKDSVKSYLRGVRGFISWTAKEGLTAERLKVQSVKVPHKVLDTLTRAEIAQMEAAADSERDRLIIRLLGDSGIRLGELLALKPDSLTVQGRQHYITVDGKGSRQRLVPILPALADRLRKYAEKGRPADDYSGRIFIGLRRHSGSHAALTARGVQTMLEAVARKAGITKAVNPHAFRHAMATNTLRAGGNPISLMGTLGHSSLKMIESTYSHLVASDRHAEMMRVLAADGDGGK